MLIGENFQQPSFTIGIFLWCGPFQILDPLFQRISGQIQQTLNDEFTSKSIPQNEFHCSSIFHWISKFQKTILRHCCGFIYFFSHPNTLKFNRHNAFYLYLLPWTLRPERSDRVAKIETLIFVMKFLSLVWRFIFTVAVQSAIRIYYFYLSNKFSYSFVHFPLFDGLTSIVDHP